MALDFDTMAPKPTEIGPSKAKRDREDNPFLSKGWLLQSYETGQAMEFGPVQGGLEEYFPKVRETGEVSTVARQRPTGDAKLVVNMLREAARLTGIGVSIEVVPLKGRGERAMVKYLGKVARQYNKRNAEDGTDE